MIEKVKSRKLKVLLVSIVGLIFLAQGCAPRWSNVLKKVKAKYTKFEEIIKDMTITQDMKMSTDEGELISEAKLYKKGKQFRMETKMKTSGMPKEMEGIKTTIIYDGKDTWMITPIIGKTKLSGEEESPYQTEKNWWDFVSEKGKIVGSEKVGRRKCYVVEFREERDSPFTKIWLDKKSLVLVQGESDIENGEKILWLNSDFRNIKGGFEKAYKTEILVNGKSMFTNMVKSLEINKGLSDDLFDPAQIRTKELDLQGLLKKLMRKGR